MKESAKYELDLLLKKCDSDDQEEIEMQKSINNHLLEMVEIFSNFGHSGFTAEYTIQALIKLLRQENLTPLTFADDEWNLITDGIYQNKRKSTVFKDKDKFEGKPYDIESGKEVIL